MQFIRPLPNPSTPSALSFHTLRPTLSLTLTCPDYVAHAAHVLTTSPMSPISPVQVWMDARIEWNKEIHQKQRVKRRHRIREQTLTMKNKFNARWIIRRAELVAAAKKEAQVT